jgi:hypothetical protein
VNAKQRQKRKIERLRILAKRKAQRGAKRPKRARRPKNACHKVIISNPKPSGRGLLKPNPKATQIKTKDIFNRKKKENSNERK